MNEYEIVEVFEGLRSYYGTLKILKVDGKFYVTIEDYDRIDYGHQISLEEARMLIKMFKDRPPKEIPCRYKNDHVNGGYILKEE